MTVGVGEIITAADIQAISDAATGPKSHEEWTATSASVATSTSASVGTLTRDAGSSNVTGLATISTNVLTVAASGLYDLTAYGSIPVIPTGLFWIRVVVGSDSFFVNGNTASAALGGPLFASLRIPASTTITCTFIHVSAASRVLTSRFSFTKVGTY